VCTGHPLHTSSSSEWGQPQLQPEQTTNCGNLQRQRTEHGPSAPLVCTCSQSAGRGGSRRGSHHWVLGVYPRTRHPHVAPTETQAAAQKHPRLPLVGTIFPGGSSNSHVLSQPCPNTSTIVLQGSHWFDITALFGLIYLSSNCSVLWDSPHIEKFFPC